MSNFDYIVIVAFLLLIVFIGLSFSKTSGKDMKSFFAAGGAVPWWINSLSLFMGFVSAGTFVVWGSIAYTSGWVAVTIQWTMSVAGFLVGMFIAPKWHKTHSLTAAEYISNRLGFNVQKIYSYLYLAIMVFMTGVYLYAISRILEVTTGLPLYVSISALGIIVILYTTLGGLWAVVVTDVLQFVILTTAAIIVVPLSFAKVGGVDGFINSIHLEGFFNFSNHEYTWPFLIGFGLYNFFYLSGQWGFVQRYTTVSKSKDAQKVGYLFGALYLISPIIWMLPPMIYRALNPELDGLQDEGAYLLMCKEALPAGMLGLILISLVLASNSSLQGVLNISAGVMTNDLYTHIFPKSTKNRLMAVARFSNIFFGFIMIGIAMMVPLMGGAKEVVLSIAALTGCPMYMPVIWSLYSKKQNGLSAIIVTIVSLILMFSLKFLLPEISEFKLTRTSEMVFGVAIPAIIILISEIWLRIKKYNESEFKQFLVFQKQRKEADQISDPQTDDSGNNQGKRMIGLGILATALIIGIIGIFADTGGAYVIGMALILLLTGGIIFNQTKEKRIKSYD